jgi:predicted DNA-binding transcriptional regulator YafY
VTAANQTLARLERLLVVVPWLLEHPGADVAAVSARLGVARDELLADLDLLGYCGLPGYGGGDLIEVSIVGDHVTLRMADFFRRPLRLSLREAVTLLLAARALAGVEGLAESAVLARAAARLESALGAGADGPRLAADRGRSTSRRSARPSPRTGSSG